MLTNQNITNNLFLGYDFLDESKDQSPEDYLSQYGTNFTQLSRRGLLEQCFSRENDVYQIMEILLRKQKNNPVLVGEPGVGKTAIVELFAERIANKDVPFIFYDYEIIGVDIAKMLAGAKFRGEFELRLSRLLDQILEENNIIIFFDELHVLKGSGTTDGALDAGNILKPALSRAGFRCLGASTPKEYKKIEEDAALNRRFQQILINEPSKAETFEILDGIRTSLEIYHNVQYTNSALIEAINLSTKYIGDRTLPDKAVDLLDRAGSREVLFRTDIYHVSIFDAILFTGLKKLSLLKIKAFRKGDIATQFVLSEIENAYKNLKLRWTDDPELDKSLLIEKENFLQKFETKNLDDDFEILTSEFNPLESKTITEKLINRNKIKLELTSLDWIQNFLNKKINSKKSLSSFNEFKFISRKANNYFQKLVNYSSSNKQSIINFFYSDIDLKNLENDILEIANFAKKNKNSKLSKKNTMLFFDFYKKNLQNSNFYGVKKRKKFNSLIGKKLLNTLVDNTSKEYNSLNPVKKTNDYLSKELKKKQKKTLNKNSVRERKKTLLKVNDYKKAFLSSKNVKKDFSVILNKLLNQATQRNNLFLEIKNITYSNILLDKILKPIYSQKYSGTEANVVNLINNSIIQRVDDLLFSSNKPKFILDNKEKKKNLSKEKTVENFKDLLSDLLELEEKNSKFSKEIKTNNLKVKILSGSILISLYRLGLIFLYKEKSKIQNILFPVDNFVKELYFIKWNTLYNFSSKYLYNYIKNLKEFNKIFSQATQSNNNFLANYFINDVVLDFIEKDAEQISILQQNLDDNNKSKINTLKNIFKTLPPLLHKRYIDILNEEYVVSNDDEKFETKSSSLSLFKKEEENSILYNFLGFFSTEKGKNFLANTDDPELVRVARKIGNYKSLTLDYRISAYEIQRLVTNLTGIPVESLTANEMKKLMNLENLLHKRVIGQNEAIATVSKAIRRSRLGIQNPSRPIGSFLFCGPTGVGKTELSKALAEAIFGSEKEMIRFDMSEFMERFSVTRLIGSPPGYIGYEEGGQLSDAVRKKPYSLVLFDEIEKAHIEVLNILLQILEDGRLTDSQKRLVLFQNTIIIMTSNAAAKEIQLTLENIEKDKKNRTKEKNELITGKTISKKNLKDTEKGKFIRKNNKNVYADPRLGKISLIPNNINTNFIIDIGDNIKENFSNSYSSQVFVNKLYQKFPELNQFNITKGKNKNLILSKKNGLNANEENREIKLNDTIKGLKKNSIKKGNDQIDIKELVMNKLTKFFLPEFINRLDDIIVFESLTYEDIIKIYDVMVEKLVKRVKKNKINLIIDPSVKGKIVNEGYSKTFGARPLRRLVTKYLEDTLSNTLLNYHGVDISKQGCIVRISLNENDIITGELIP